MLDGGVWALMIGWEFKRMVTIAAGGAMAEKVGVLSLVMLSLSLTPESLEESRSGWDGMAGGVPRSKVQAVMSWVAVNEPVPPLKPMKATLSPRRPGRSMRSVLVSVAAP